MSMHCEISYTLGDLALFAGLVFQVRRSLQIFFGNSANLHDVALGSHALFRFLDLLPDEEKNDIPISKTTKNHQEEGIIIQDLSFSYPGSASLALHDINLSIKPGETIVIVGENGAGKTTLTKLLCRLYDPQKGTITWNGNDIHSLEHTALRQRISVVMQDHARFPISLRENIGIGNIELLHDSAIMHSAATAGLSTLIDTLPDKLETPLSKQFEQGTDLSGGQWQRVAIARAFMRQTQSQLLILDEPTAALDPKTEHEMFTLFQTMASDKMAVIVSHRLALARIAHKIVVLEHGTILEEGTHEALMMKKGRYYEMFVRQASSYADMPFKHHLHD